MTDPTLPASGTPITDAAAEKGFGGLPAEFVSAHVARQLEKELQAAQRELAGLREEVLKLRNKVYKWTGADDEPARWTAPDGTIVYRSYEDYVDD